MDELGGLAATLKRWRAPFVVAATVPLLVLLTLPLAHVAGPVVPGFNAAWTATVLVADVVTTALLIGLYRSGRGVRMLVLAGAFAWSACVVLMTMFALPGVLSADPTFGSSGGSLGWLWMSRHIGPPLLLAVALAPWPRRWEARVEHPPPHSGVLAGLIVVLLAGPGWMLLEMLAFPELLPVVRDPETSALVLWALLLVLATTSTAVVAVTVGVVRRGMQSGVEVWTIVAAFAWLGDVVFVIVSEHMYSVSWYLARLLGLAASLIVPTSILVTTWRLQQRMSAGHQDLEEQVDRLLEAQRLRDHVSAVVSHDMRTPLAGLHGYLEVLVEDEGLNPELVRRMHERSLMLTRRLTLLSEDLLAATTVEHGDLVLTPLDLDLAEQLAECATGFPDLDLRIDCPGGVSVHADPLRLQQVLTNLVRNAQKHGAEPVTVSVTPAPDRAGALVTVRVRDEGEGVPESFIPRLFERYSQGARTAGGAGIGLSVVHDLVQAHGGTIRYDLTEPAFIVTLPAAAPAAAPGIAELPGQRGRVLSAPQRRARAS